MIGAWDPSFETYPTPDIDNFDGTEGGGIAFIDDVDGIVFGLGKVRARAEVGNVVDVGFAEDGCLRASAMC